MKVLKKLPLAAVAIFIATFLLFTGNESNAAASFVQQKAGAAASGASSLATTFTSNVAAGDIILVGFDFDKSQNANVSSVTDSRGNTFTQIGTELTSPGGAHTRLYYAKSATAGADTVTISLTAGSSFIEAYITAYRGIDSVSPIDTSAGRSGSAGAVTSGNATTTSAGDVIYGFCIGDNACTLGSGFTARSTMNSNLSEDKITTSTGVFAATASASAGWTMQMVALRPAITADTTRPSTPTNLAATAISTSQINLTWTASTDNVGVTGYKVFRDGSQIATTTTVTSFSNTGLTPSTTYIYNVAAFDAAGNVSTSSVAVSATTQSLPQPDTQAPTVPTNLSATAVSTSQINLNWTASTDNVAVTGYKVFRGGVQIATTTVTSFSNTGLLPSTNYSYTVTAFDAAGNTSTPSTVASATTQALPVIISVSPSNKSLVINNSQTFICTVTGPADTSCSWSIQEGALGGSVSSTGSSSSIYTAPANTGIYHLIATSNADPAKTSTATISVVSPSSTFPFPLHVSADHRRLEDGNGQAFLIKGDSAWSLVAGLNDQDADLFLSDRQQKGFNTVLASIIEHKFVPQAPLNAFGVAPFTTPGDFSTPNEAYFAHVDNLLSMAAQKNMLVLLTPAYLGFPNTDEGWYDELIANGTTTMHAYGQYLGNRYKNYNNLIWVVGGDREPDLALPEVEAMVQGIKDSGSNQLITIHGTRDNSQMDAYPATDSWINFNSTYTTCNTLPSRISNDYNHAGPFPTFMIEAWYENEHSTSLACLHGQEYWPTLMGATGSLFGNDPIWFFGTQPSDGNPGWSFGDGQFLGGWTTALNSQGSIGAKFAHQLFNSRPWQDLLPDSSHLTLTAGFGSINNNTFGAAARTANGGTVIVYTPSQRNLTINMTKVSGTNANAWWYNPTTGAESLIGVFPTTGSHVFNPPASGDWVLVLDDNALQLASPGTGSIPAPAVVAPADTQAPTAPTSLSAITISTSQINLSWTASTDNIGVAGYKIFRGGIQVATTTVTTSFSNTGLTPSTTFTYTVTAFDAAGNTSTPSVAASATTQSAADTTAPSTPTNLAATPVSISQINLTWNTSTDNIGVTGYKLFQGGVQIATTSATNTSFANTGLNVSTTYSYTVSAFDAAGNISSSSVVVIGTTFNSPQLLTAGPLRVLTSNPRYFNDGTGKAIYLAGSHTWSNLLDRGTIPTPPAFDYNSYMNFMTSHGYNFMRLWTAGMTNVGNADPNIQIISGPLPWARTGAGLANDGKPKFNLTQFDQAYFNRMRARVIQAGQNGIYVGVQLFDGYNLEFGDSPNDGNPFASTNNVNGIDCAGNCSQDASQIPPAVWSFEQAYIHKVIDTIGDLDNVLYEVANEAGDSYSTNWQYNVINEVKNYETTKAKQHPVGMTYQYFNSSAGDTPLFNSPADWISTGEQLPAGTGAKVIINDTDHSYGWSAMKGDGQTAQRQWAWENFTNGNGTLFMDPYLVEWSGRNNPGGTTSDPGIGTTLDTYWNVLRNAIRDTASYANRINLAAMIPTPGCSSTGFCLANSDTEFLAYQPGTGTFNVNTGAGLYTYEWFNAATGAISQTGTISVTAGTNAFTPPFTGDAVLYLKKTIDTQAPSMPTNLSAIATSTSQINLSWTTSTDNIGVTGYKIFRDGTQIATTTATATSYASTGLASSTTYTYAVAAFDAANNVSATSSPASATTFAPPDTISPSMPINLSATAISSSQINLTWTASTDNVGVTGYKVLRNGVQVGTSATNNYSDTGLLAATFYSYFILSFDAAGNISGQQVQTL